MQLLDRWVSCLRNTPASQPPARISVRIQKHEISYSEWKLKWVRIEQCTCVLMQRSAWKHTSQSFRSHACQINLVWENQEAGSHEAPGRKETRPRRRRDAFQCDFQRFLFFKVPVLHKCALLPEWEMLAMLLKRAINFGGGDSMFPLKVKMKFIIDVLS